MEIIINYTVKTNQGSSEVKEFQVVSTVQLKNIIFSTESKLANKVIDN